MPTIPVYNQRGEKVRELTVSDAVFGVPENVPLVHQVAMAQRANARRVIAHTKDRGEVRGGGRKPWKQKGTGRARHGSIRSPLWVGGGITFGPTSERSFAQRINQKMRQKALACVLSDKMRNNTIVVIDSLDLPDTKTKTFAAVFAKLPMYTAKKKSASKTLVALEKSNPQLIRAARNITEVFVTEIANINVVDAMRFPYLVLTEGAVAKLEQRFA